MNTHPLFQRLRRLAPWLGLALFSTSTPALLANDDDGGSGGRFPRVSIHAIDAEAIETNREDTLVFEFRRTGETTTPLDVFFKATGKAVIGADYSPVDPASITPLQRDHRGRPMDPTTHRIVIPAGETGVRLVLAPIPDSRLEHDERLTLHVRPSTIWKTEDGPNQSYRPGEPEAAHAIIREVATPAGPDAPVVTVVATQPETTEPAPEIRVRPGVFTLSRTGPLGRPLRIHYTVEGSARNGVDYAHLDGDTTLGASQSSKEVRVEALADAEQEPDEEVILRIRPAGTYQVGEASSATVVIHDSGIRPPASLVFTAPDPGSTFDAPASVALALRAVDPAGYIPRVEFFSGDTSIGVSEINFIQAPEPGTPIEHHLEWKDVAAGDYRIVARAVDSRGNPVASGALPLVVRQPVPPPPVVRHPADLNPADDILTGEEIAAYAEAWRTGTPPAAGPAPVPVAFLTRGGFLWKTGGGYRFDPGAGDLPLAWITTATDAGTPSDGTISFAIAEVPMNDGEGSFGLVVRAGPAPNVRSYALELRLAPGSTASAISDDGTFDPATATLRWGPFHDDTDRRLTASITSPAVSQVGGIASFDGVNSPVVRVPPPPPLPGGSEGVPTLATVLPTDDGDVQLVIVDDNPDTDSETELEVSTDLKNWMGVHRQRGRKGVTAVVDGDADETTVRFYRVVRRRP